MATPRTNNALQIIFSFFLGLMVVAFVGVGVNTFYPSPETKAEPERQELQRELDQIYRNAGDKTPQGADKLKADALQKQIDAINDRVQKEMQIWFRNTSIILIVFATLVMAVSLIRSEQLRVISNGLLLGGLFTMVYGIGLAIFSGQSTARFLTITVALLVTVGLGYVKFVRERQAAAVPAAAGGAVAMDDANAAALAARIADLEARFDAAAAALGGKQKD